MPNTKKISLAWSETGKTVYTIIRREADSYRLNDADGTFAAAPADPYLSLTEDAVVKGFYEVSEARASWNNGNYFVFVYRQTGGSPAPASDIIIGSSRMSIVSDTEVDSIDVITIDGIVDDILLDTAVIGVLGAGLTALATQTSLDALKDVADVIQADTDLLDDVAGGLVDIHTDVVAVKTDTAAILVDTGTDGVVVATASKTGYALSSAGIQAIWDALTSVLTTVGSIGKKLADWVVGTIDTYTGNTKQTGDAFTRLGAPAGASISADVAAVKSDFGSVKTQTDKLTFDSSDYIKSVQQFPEGAVVADGNNGAASFKTNRSEVTDDYWKDSWIKFTSGNLERQVKKVSAYNGTSKFITVSSPFTVAPTASDTFCLINE